MKLETAAMVNVMNVGELVENAIFTTYPHESKGLGERGERCTAVFWLSLHLCQSFNHQSPDHQITQFSEIPC